MNFRDKAYEVFNMFDKQWALATAGTIDDFDGCTIGWGSLGDVWGGVSSGRLIATIYVRPDRYTWNYLMRNDYFTISFFPEKYRKDLGLLGSRSKRDCDKFAMTNITAAAHDRGVIFEEAELTFVCRKIYWEQFNRDHMADEFKDGFYGNRPVHYQFIGEIVDVIEAEQ